LGDDSDVYAETTTSAVRRYGSSDNENIISLGDGFGKY